MRHFPGLCLIGVIIGGSTSVRAAVPATFTVQGVLRDGSGNLQSMPITLSVAFFDAQTGGKKIAETAPFPNVPVVSGLFTQIIHDADLINGAHLTDLSGAAEAWLQVTTTTAAGKADTYAPQLVTPNIYALICGSADVASSLSCANCVTDAMIGGVAGGKVNGAVNDSARLGGVPASQWYPVQNVTHKGTAGNYYLPATTVLTEVTDFSVTVLPGGPRGFFFASLSGSCNAGNTGLLALSIGDQTTQQKSGPIADGAGSTGNSYALNSVAGWSGCSLQWIEPVMDASPQPHTFDLWSSLSVANSGARMTADLSVIWFPSP